ncbi:MAG: exonuclease subunit SbcD [Mobiluncus sp.]|uniref:Nuclease SbcCD subunit D n=1 Tax=Mobiluncus porci TaxID=2652278 RepID=A0A7K0K3A5_9ACTO|nr:MULTISPECIES: exonuclease subunit SbcD [Mobiluncus]MCI6583755.1 exonuclease subunit SbcD [Mobiluncus sp.]MST49898.1 exonuclease subunit SbcD [Mobiluncus porci]
MKLLHTSDWHLGRSFYSRDLEEYQRAYLDHLLAVIEEEQVDALLVAGDVFDKINPSDISNDLYGGFMERAIELTDVILISGNHDGASRMRSYINLVRERLHLFTSATQVGQAVEIREKNMLKGLVYPIPYLSPYSDVVELSRWRDKEGTHLDEGVETVDADGNSLGEGLLPDTSEALFGAALRRIGRDLDQRGEVKVPIVAMAHDYFCKSDFADTLSAAGNLLPIRASVVDELEEYNQQGRLFDYLALGHLHSCGKVPAKTHIQYSGSPLPYRASEEKAKVSLLVEVEAGKPPSIREIPAPMPYHVKVIQDTVENLKSDKYQDYRDWWCEITILDSSSNDSRLQVQALFPHSLVRVGYSLDTVHLTMQNLSAASELSVTTDFLRPLLEHSEFKEEILKRIPALIDEVKGVNND